MLMSMQAAILALSALMAGAQSEIRISSQSLAAPPILEAAKAAIKRGVKVKVLIGAKADYQLDEKGQPTGGNRPYDTGPQGPELARLQAMGAQTYIPPRFSELDAVDFQPGVEFNSAYAVVDRAAAIVCTGAFKVAKDTNAVCWQDTLPQLAAGLFSLHEADFNFRLPPPQKLQMVDTIRGQGLLVTPENVDGFKALLAQSWSTVYTSALSDGPITEMLFKTNPAVLVLSTKSTHSRTAISQLSKAGWTIKYSAKPFSGTILISSGAVYIGSQRLDPLHLSKSRDLGILLPASSTLKASELLGAF